MVGVSGIIFRSILRVELRTSPRDGSQLRGAILSALQTLWEKS